MNDKTININTIVIGAGVSGLTSLKNLLENNIETILLEKSEYVGKIFNF